MPPEPGPTLPPAPRFDRPSFGQPGPQFGAPAFGSGPPFAQSSTPRTHGLATAALVCGLTGLLLFWVFALLPILAVVFGLVSARTVKKSNGMRRGLGMARAGWILGLIGMAGFGVFLWAAVTGRIDGNDDTIAVDAAAVGDCISNLPPEEGEVVIELDVVECSAQHEAEVYRVDHLNAERSRDFPGDAKVTAEVQELCLEQFELFVGLDYDHSVLDIYYLQPNKLGWKSTRGGYTCLVYEPGKSVVGSLSGAAR